MMSQKIGNCLISKRFKASFRTWNSLEPLLWSAIACNSFRFFNSSPITSTSSPSILPPDWSPTAVENDNWLDSLSESPLPVAETQRFENTVQNLDFVNASPKWGNILSSGRMKYSIPQKWKLSIPLDQFKGLRTSQHLQKGFSDVKLVSLRAGSGGNGSISFFRDAGRAIGPPDGGDGGEGGSVFVQAVEGVSSLHKLKVRYSAFDGGHGKARNLDGPRGKDVVITVPVGTTIRWIPPTEEIKLAEKDEEGSVPDHVVDSDNIDGEKYILLKRGTSERKAWLFKEKDEEYHLTKEWFQKLDKKMQKYDRHLLHEERYVDVFPVNGLDLSEPSKTPILLMKGGSGGLGNMHFLTKEIRNPRFSKPGRPALEGNFMFELKLLAQFGLVGLPNSGKSTLLNSLTNANSKVGSWQFTTLQPQIGTIVGVDSHHKIADIPGIISGAATCIEKPKGMGVEFLRHIERSKSLIFVVSLEKSPQEDLQVLLTELTFGKDRMKGKKTMVVATKCDLVKETVFLEFKQFVREKMNCPVVPVSALNGENVDRLATLIKNFE